MMWVPPHLHTSVLYAGFLFYSCYRIYIGCRVFDAVTHWPALYFVVGVSNDYWGEPERAPLLRGNLRENGRVVHA